MPENLPSMDPNTIISSTATHLQEMTQMMMGGGEAAFEQNMKSMMKPLDVTPDVVQRIKALRKSEALSWFFDVDLTLDYDAAVNICNIYLVDEETKQHFDAEHGVGGSLKISVCTCVHTIEEETSRTHHWANVHTQLKEKEDKLILGTFAKALVGGGDPFRSQKFPQIVPREVLLESSGKVARLKEQFKYMGVSKVVSYEFLSRKFCFLVFNFEESQKCLLDFFLPSLFSLLHTHR